MTKNIYVAIAPDGSEHIRKTDRTYTHAVLVQRRNGWSAVGFCGRPDLADKKHREHPRSIVVECGVLGDCATDEAKVEGAENADPIAPHAENPPVKPKRTIGRLVQELLMDETLDYTAIVERVSTEFSNAKTTARSVASVAAVLRKKGVDVPKRR